MQKDDLKEIKLSLQHGVKGVVSSRHEIRDDASRMSFPSMSISNLMRLLVLTLSKCKISR
jgi:hypothetical protein